jgi:hypothetical protein
LYLGKLPAGLEFANVEPWDYQVDPRVGTAAGGWHHRHRLPTTGRFGHIVIDWEFQVAGVAADIAFLPDENAAPGALSFFGAYQQNDRCGAAEVALEYIEVPLIEVESPALMAAKEAHGPPLTPLEPLQALAQAPVVTRREAVAWAIPVLDRE